MPREQKPNQVQVSFLMDKQDHKTITAKAKELGMSLAAYMKFTALNAEIKCTMKEGK